MQSLVVFTFNSNYKEVANNIGKELLEQGYELNNYKLNDINDTIIIHSLQDLTQQLESAVSSIKSNSLSIIIVKDSDLELNQPIYNLFSGKDNLISLIKYDYDKTKKHLSNRQTVLSKSVYELVSQGYESGYVIGYINLSLRDYGLDFNDFLETVISVKSDQKVVRLSDKVKKMIARRDEAGVTRKAIANELGVNYKTVQRACRKFGISKKSDGTTNENNSLEVLTTDFHKDGNRLICPKCGKKTNIIDEKISDNRFYCKHCLEEYIIMEKNLVSTLHRVKWETIS